MQEDKIKEIVLAASALRVGDANEAMTRLKLIDMIIFDLLQWHKDDVSVEARVLEDGVTQFADYTVSSGRHAILIEAKKIGVPFEGAPKARKALLKGNWLNSRAGAAVRQVRDYGRRVSVGFCVATNGSSWIVFPINRRDQVSFEESTAIIFHDVIETLTDDPDEFVGLLSRSAVIAGSLDRALLGYDRDQTEPRRLNQIYDHSFSRVTRDSVFPAIEREVVTAFNEELLSDNVDVLEKCYVATPERTRFDSRIQMYVAPREQVLKARPIKPVGRRGGDVTVRRLLQETRLNSRPIALLTVGLVGSGKTTFLNYTSKVTARSMFSKGSDPRAAHWIYADFRDFSTAGNAREFLVSAIFEYIKSHPYLNSFEKCISHAYEDEIKSLKTGPLSIFATDQDYVTRQIGDMLMADYQKKEPYAQRIIRYATSKSPVFLVVDNVDQIEKGEKQAEIFLEATALARTLGANLILAMRDATYAKNRSSAVFNAFDFDAVYIDPPNILEVLSKRFTVAQQLLEGRDVAIELRSGGRHIPVNASQIIALLSRSVLGTEVGRIIEVAATGDTRLALQMTRQFLQYGYSSSIKALVIYQQSGEYKLPPHEALRAIMLGNQTVYREEFSVIGNPFDARLGRSDLQFLRIYLMYVLVAYSSEREFEGLPARDLIENLERIGVSESASEKVLRDMIRARFIFSRSHHEYTRESIVIPSRLCGYIVRELLERLMFIETAMFDTFISEDVVWDSIKANMNLVYREKKNFARKFQYRKEIVITFFDYVETKVEVLVSQARQKGLAPQWCVNPLSKARDGFIDDTKRAAESAKRNYGPSSMLTKSEMPLFRRGEGQSRYPN